MNYRKIHDAIIGSAKSREIDPLLNYERHHIIPKAMGGTDEDSNLVRLTVREHFVVHMLLWRIYRNRQMASALWMMTNCRRYKAFRLSSRRYEKFRLNYIKRIKGRIPHNIDKTIYKFKNIFSEKSFIGTRKDFKTKFHIQPSPIIKHGKMVAGWKLENNKNVTAQPNQKEKYSFINIYTGETFTGTCVEFKKAKNTNFSHMYVKNSKKMLINGWKILNSRLSNLTLAKIRIHNFININTDKTFSGTVSDFKKATGISAGGLARGHNKSSFGWKITSSTLPEYAHK